MAKKKSGMQVRIIKEQRQQQAQEPVAKADTSTQVTTQDAFNAGDWITPPLDMRGLKRLVKNSSILPQCIRAYKNNICGFGIGVRYIEDVEETPEMAAEFKRAEEVIELLNIEQDTKEVFEDLVEARETYGIAYLEVIRNLADEVVQIEFIKETPSITKTKPLEPYVSSIYYHHGAEAERKKRYCKYRQEIGGRVVYFKEFGDPRIMDRRDGKYLKEGETLELEYQANEIMEFTIGTEPYGEIRWVGQMLGVDGSRKAEGLNNNYFENGRHTPLMIMIEGGTLSDESFDKLQQYMNDIKGEAGQHAFIVLETESTDGRVDFDQSEQPKITIKDLASILQKDELFQDYLDNNRRKVQSAFQLPDLYVGYTTDFNRATAQTAQEVTEEQVFQPERKSLAWAINNRLLNGYQFKYVECYFLEPDISNPDDLAKLLTIANAAGGLTPNKAKQIVYEAFGEVAEDYEEEWGDIPLAVQKQQAGAGGMDMSQMLLAMQQQITKAESANDDAVVAVMKEVKRLLEKNVFTNDPKRGIIKGDWNEDDHPRDENGRFASGGGGGSSSDDSAGGSGGGTAGAQVDGPRQTKAYISQYFSEHPEVEKEAEKYKDVMEKVSNFQKDNPDAQDGTYSATTGKLVTGMTGYCVTFHQNLTADNPYGGYDSSDYAAMCAIAKHELGSKDVYIGYFGNAEVSFTCKDRETAMNFAIAHNQHSVYDSKADEVIINPYYNADTNPIENH